VNASAAHAVAADAECHVKWRPPFRASASARVADGPGNST